MWRDRRTVCPLRLPLLPQVTDYSRPYLCKDLQKNNAILPVHAIKRICVASRAHEATLHFSDFEVGLFSLLLPSVSLSWLVTF
jgi:hypothetical protein